MIKSSCISIQGLQDFSCCIFFSLSLYHLYLSIVFRALTIIIFKDALLWWCLYYLKIAFAKLKRLFPLLSISGEGLFKPIIFAKAQYWCFFKAGAMCSRPKGFFPSIASWSRGFKPTIFSILFHWLLIWCLFYCKMASSRFTRFFPSYLLWVGVFFKPVVFALLC